jgi:hypothetical protein
MAAINIGIRGSRYLSFESPIFGGVWDLEDIGWGSNEDGVGAYTQGFGNGHVMKPWNDVDLVGSILHLVVEEVDDTNLGVANHRR